MIQAIETSHPHQAIVLQKVCKAVKTKVKSEDLDDRCNLLNNPDSLKAIRTASQAKATPVAQAASPEPAPKPAQPAPVVEQPKPAVQTVTPAPTPVPAPAATAPAQEYWTLQLGAFGTKSNADLLVSNLKKHKIACTVLEQPRGERTLYLVQTGKFETKDQAVDYAASKLAPLKIEYQPLLKR